MGTQRYGQRPHACQGAVDEAYESPEEIVEEIPRKQEDRPTSLSRALRQVQGLRVQEQARFDGIHSQKEGGDAEIQAVGRPGRSQAYEEQGSPQTQRGAHCIKENGIPEDRRQGGRGHFIVIVPFQNLRHWLFGLSIMNQKRPSTLKGTMAVQRSQ